jgi:hypothetical protein
LTGQWAARRLAETARPIAFAATFLVAFAAYEAVLFAVAVALLGGTEDFTGEILGRILAINAAAFVGLVVLNRLAVSVGLLASPTAAFSMSERHA